MRERLSGAFPKYKIYGLSSQFRRAAGSIAANIAEGFRKRSKAKNLRFFNIVQGSVEEYITTNSYEILNTEF